MFRILHSYFNLEDILPFEWFTLYVIIKMINIKILDEGIYNYNLK